MLKFGAARNPEDLDRERREPDREERMGQLRGSTTRALPPGPPAGAAPNRLRNGGDPVASTPASRIQQSGNTSPRAISRVDRERKVSMRLHRGAPANVSSSDLTGRQEVSRISASQASIPFDHLGKWRLSLDQCLLSVFTVFHLLLKTTKFKFFLTFIFCQWREPCRRCWFQRRHKNVSVKEGFASPPSFQIYWQSRTAEVPPASSKLNTTYRYILYIFFLFFSLPP